MEWWWGRGRGEAHDGAVVQRNRQWRSVLVELARRRHSVLVAVRAEEGDGSENGECVGQVCGVLKTRLSVPGRPRRVACALRREATGGTKRPATSEPVGHNATELFQKNVIQ